MVVACLRCASISTQSNLISSLRFMIGCRCRSDGDELESGEHGVVCTKSELLLLTEKSVILQRIIAALSSALLEKVYLL